MSQNIISLSFTEADYAEVDAALQTLEAKLAPLISLSGPERRALAKMGDKSEAFCRQTLMVLAQNPLLLPPGFGLAEAQRDLAQLELLRSRTARLRQLLGRAEDSEQALGSDVMSAALEGYALLKVLGKGSGLEALRKEMSARFARNTSGSKAAAEGADARA